MDSDGIMTRVLDGIDPDYPILCAPLGIPRCTVADVEAATAQAPAFPIEEENPNSDDEDVK